MNSITLIILAIIFWLPITIILIYVGYLLFIFGAVILAGIVYFLAGIEKLVKKLLRIG
jgi:uncharacterized membrane protein